MLSGFGALDQLPPLDHLDLHLNADLGQIRLQQFGAGLGIGVQRAAAGPHPYRGFETVWIACLGQQLLGSRRIVGIGLHALVITPRIGRIRQVRRGGGVVEYRFQVAALIESQVERLPHQGVVQRLFLAVEGDEGRHESRGLQHLQLGIDLGRQHILRLG